MVYVDDSLIWFGRMRMSHMMADTDEELDTMARRLGLNPKWKQVGWHGHYDVCKSKRAEAIRLGAKEVSTRELVAIFHRRRS